VTKVQRRSSHRPARWLVGGIIVVGFVSMINVAAMIAFAVAKVRAGRGLETYRTFWLVEDDYIGFLIFVACVLGAVGVGLVLRLIQQRREHRDWAEHDRKWVQKLDA
jgi:hypothetical protein